MYSEPATGGEDQPPPTYPNGEPSTRSAKQSYVWQNPQSPDRNTWVQLKFGNHKYCPELRFNPVVSGVSILLVFAFVAWSILDAEGEVIIMIIWFCCFRRAVTFVAWQSKAAVLRYCSVLRDILRRCGEVV